MKGDCYDASAVAKCRRCTTMLAFDYILYLSAAGCQVNIVKHRHKQSILLFMYYKDVNDPMLLVGTD